MASPLNLLTQSVTQGQAKIIYAQVTTPLPTSFESKLYVVMPDWTTTIPVAIDDWPAVNGSNLPALNNDALLIIDSRGNRRCVWWGSDLGTLWGGVSLPSSAPTNIGQPLLSTGTSTSAWGAPILSTTSVQNFNLSNGTIQIAGLSTPAGGLFRTAVIAGAVVVSSNETGGQIQASWTFEFGAQTQTLQAGTSSTGTYFFNTTLIADPGTAVLVNQSTALTGGAAQCSVAITTVS
jgi:hypothetical protein